MSMSSNASELGGPTIRITGGDTFAMPGPPKPFLNELTLEDIEQTGINLTEARRIVFNTSSFPAREMSQQQEDNQRNVDDLEKKLSNQCLQYVEQCLLKKWKAESV